MALRLLRHFHNPFVGLAKAQKTLLALRIGSALVAVCVAVALYALRGSPSSFYIARINCAHLDVATGLYQSLRSLMTESMISKGVSEDVLPISMGLTDSEIAILSKYAQTQVLNAPQALVLGSLQWCAVSYTTDFVDMEEVYTNMTTTCFDYGSLNFYDYRTLLLENQLEIILAYAYQSGSVQSALYQSRIAARLRRYHAMRVMYAVQLALQIALLAAGVLVYATRGGAPDLATAAPLTLNAVALVLLAAGCMMVVATAIMLADLAAMRSEISAGLGDFGFLMATGTLFAALVGAALAAASVGMLAWTVPLWCSNPPDRAYDFDEQLHSARAAAAGAADADVNAQGPSGLFAAKPYQLHRQTQLRTSSRLFDETTDLAELSDALVDEKYTRSGTASSGTASSGTAHSEHELRRLGETLARKLSVRQANAGRRQVPAHWLAQKKDTHNLLYGPNPLSNHQYPQAFAKPMDVAALSRAASLTDAVPPPPLVRTRHLLGEAGSDARVLDETAVDAGVLDDAEMQYLDNSRFVNRWTQ